MRVLYVEDNQDVRELTELMFQDEGLEFVSRGNAATAELAFEKEHFELSITDISLPDLQGTVLATRLQQRSPHLWIVFCSGLISSCWQTVPGLQLQLQFRAVSTTRSLRNKVP